MWETEAVYSFIFQVNITFCAISLQLDNFKVEG